MTVQELINKLNAIKELHGEDIPVVLSNDMGYDEELEADDLFYDVHDRQLSITVE